MKMKLRNGFIDEVKGIIENSRTQVIQSVHHVWARMYWGLGRKIFEEEQMESERAEYGIYLFKHLSVELFALYGESFSRRQLERYIQFHRLYPIASALRTQFTWTHYRFLLRMDDQLKNRKNTATAVFFCFWVVGSELIFGA
jgi:hypothetical protein